LNNGNVDAQFSNNNRCFVDVTAYANGDVAKTTNECTNMPRAFRVPASNINNCDFVDCFPISNQTQPITPTPLSDCNSNN